MTPQFFNYCNILVNAVDCVSCSICSPIISNPHQNGSSIYQNLHLITPYYDWRYCEATWEVSWNRYQEFDWKCWEIWRWFIDSIPLSHVQHEFRVCMLRLALNFSRLGAFSLGSAAWKFWWEVDIELVDPPCSKQFENFYYSTYAWKIPNASWNSISNEQSISLVLCCWKKLLA